MTGFARGGMIRKGSIQWVPQGSCVVPRAIFDKHEMVVKIEITPPENPRAIVDALEAHFRKHGPMRGLG